MLVSVSIWMAMWMAAKKDQSDIFLENSIIFISNHSINFFRTNPNSINYSTQNLKSPESMQFLWLKYLLKNKYQ